MKLFFYDLETTGMPLWGQPSGDPAQPHIVQAAAALVDSQTHRVGGSINLIAKPDGWEIGADVAEVHGITTERALEVGVPEPFILESLLALWAQADARVAHNEGFDARIVRIAIKRFLSEETADYWKAGKTYCTAKLAGPVMKLPPTERMRAAGRTHHKTPNLIEAYWHFTGQPLKNAHSAAVDLKACMAVWFALAEKEASA